MAGLPKLLIITGSTASGKSALLYEALAELPLTVINADSRQVYRDLRISSASPSSEQLSLLPHRLYNYLEIVEKFSAGRFVREATVEIEAALASGRIPVVCGGTYFYLQSLLEGLLPATEIPETIRRDVEALSAADAWEELLRTDAIAAARMHPNNRVRVNRALMLVRTLGRPISSLPRVGGILADYDILMVVLTPSKEWLRFRVVRRIEEMLREGLVAEADAVVQKVMQSAHANWRQVPALTGIGIQEFLDAWEKTGIRPREFSPAMVSEATEKITQNTMQLVKRQMTWFRNASSRPANTKTVDPAYEPERLAVLVRDFLFKSTP